LTHRAKAATCIDVNRTLNLQLLPGVLLLCSLAGGF